MSGLISCVAVMTAFGGEDPNKEDLNRFQGKWKAVSVMDDGKPAKAGFTWTIEGSKILYGGGWYGAMTLHAKENPKAYDFDHFDAGGRERGKGFKAIYKFDGEDKMTWCVPLRAEAPRPKAFESKPGDGNRLIVLERVKK
jgi:uncharacterized protein (TIGR03067 family)